MIALTDENKHKGCLVGCLFVCLTPFVLFLILLVWLCSPSNPITTAERMLGIELPHGTKLVSAESDGGPPILPGGLSDGYTWLVLQVPLDQLSNVVTSVSKYPDWKALPLPEKLAAGERYLQPTSMYGAEGHIPIQAAEGFYMFRDLQIEMNRKYNPHPPYQTDKPFWERPSRDYIFGLLDTRTGRIYVLCINT